MKCFLNGLAMAVEFMAANSTCRVYVVDIRHFRHRLKENRKEEQSSTIEKSRGQTIE